MKKLKVFAILLLVSLLVVSTAGAELKLNVWSFTNEMQGLIEKYYAPNHPEIEFTYEIYPTDGNGYTNRIDNILSVPEAAVSEEAPDIFTMEAAFVKDYVDSDLTANLKDVGFTDEELSVAYPVMLQIGQDEAGTQKGLSWQATPGVLMYRASLAEKYLGVESPEEMQAKVADWESFLKTAEELNEKSGGACKMVCGSSDIWNAYQYSRDQGWVVDGKLVIDGNLLDYEELIKTMKEENLTQDAWSWGEVWFAGMRGELETLCYFLPTWGLNYVLEPNCSAVWDPSDPDNEENIAIARENGTYGDWRLAEGPEAYNWGGTWLGVNAEKAAAADEEKKAAIHDLLSFFTLYDDFLFQYAADSGDFVGSKKAVDTILANGGTPDPFLAGQDSYSVFAQAAAKADGSLVTEYDDELNNLWDQYVTSPYTSGEVTLEEGIERFITAVEAQFPGVIDTSETDTSGKKNPMKLINGFVARCYELLMNRKADQAGMDYWSNSLASHEQSASEIIDDFTSSEEFRNRPLSSGEKVEILYNTMLDRDPDSDGRDYWIGQLEAGVSEAAIINGFCGSEEFGAICAGYGIEPGSVDVKQPDQPDQPAGEGVEGFVQRCYTKALDRAFDQGGVDYWVEQMRGGLKPQDVAKQFIFSEEATNMGRSNDEFIKTLYRLYMGREADDGGLAYWNGKMAEGMTYEQVNDGFAGSEEFAAIVAGFGL